MTTILNLLARAEIISLRQYQRALVDAIRATLRSGKRRVLAYLPTGAGKTRVATAITQMTLAKSTGRVIVLANRKQLVHQFAAALRAAGADSRTPLPAFDKLADDRAPKTDWPVFAGRPSAVLVDGWCLGATPQAEADLAAPINALEAERDGQGIWRHAANTALAGPYAEVFARFDAVLFLKAPSFDAVLDWRCEQEAGLMGLPPADLPPARRAELAVFIQHFERITRHMLAGGVRADLVFQLDADRRLSPPASGRS